MMEQRHMLDAKTHQPICGAKPGDPYEGDEYGCFGCEGELEFRLQSHDL